MNSVNVKISRSSEVCKKYGCSNFEESKFLYECKYDFYPFIKDNFNYQKIPDECSFKKKQELVCALSSKVGCKG